MVGGVVRRRLLSTAIVARPPVDKFRNFGIIAHIDAGKTTVSERMLYYAGRTRYIGEVHDGDTVMDHMVEERKRGITITSSCISLHWQGHRLNLVDSPGHVDFTVEVERCMRVLDGAVTVIDAVAGVQVQTETVWGQAEKYHVPCIAFANKMDRDGADLDATADSIKSRLGAVPWLLQRPLVRDGKFVGVVDLVSLTGIEFGGKRGQELLHYRMDQHADYVLARNALIESVSELNDTVLDAYLEGKDVTAIMLQNAIRDAVHQRRPVVPVLCGAAYRDIGVQPLLDAVCDYLPAPTVDNTTSLLRALVFKLVHDPRRGPIAMTRLYCGRLTNRDVLCVRGEKIRVAKLLQIDAGDYHEIDECYAGDICAVIGLKHVRTGDVLRTWDDRHDADEEQNGMAISVPQPVFFCSIEPDSGQHDAALKTALQCLVMEDPSLEVTTDNDTGQTVIKGMGELHLEIVRDRLRHEFNVDATLGRMSVSYREAPTVDCTESVTHRIEGRHPVSVRATLQAWTESPDGVAVCHTGARLRVAEQLSAVPSDVLAVLDALAGGLRGPLLGFPMCRARVTLLEIRADGNVSVKDMGAAFSHCLNALIRSCRVALLEPVVELELHCHVDYLGEVTSDLNRRRRGQVVSVITSSSKATMVALVPLAMMMGYSTSVRSLCQGTAHFSTRFRTFEPVSDHEQEKILNPSY